jgi:hypothetical protein
MACPLGYGDSAKAALDAAVRLPLDSLPGDIRDLLAEYTRRMPDCSEPYRSLNRCQERVARENAGGSCLAESKCYLACSRAHGFVERGVSVACDAFVSRGVQPSQVRDDYSQCVAAAAKSVGPARAAAAGECAATARALLQCAVAFVSEPSNCPHGGGRGFSDTAGGGGGGSRA